MHTIGLFPTNNKVWLILILLFFIIAMVSWRFCRVYDARIDRGCMKGESIVNVLGAVEGSGVLLAFDPSIEEKVTQTSNQHDKYIMHHAQMYR